MKSTTFYTSPVCYSDARAADYVRWALTRAAWRNDGQIGNGNSYWVRLCPKTSRIIAEQGHYAPWYAVPLDGDTFATTSVWNTPRDVVALLLSLASQVAQ